MMKKVLMNESPIELAAVHDIEVDDDSLTVGRYVLHRQIARGGMATIHIARLMGDEGFSRIVAAKRLLPEFAEDSDFVAMFLDEARIASKCHHRNVVPVLDVVTTHDEVLLVQEYVHGAPLHYLLNRARHAHERTPVPIAVSIACGVLAGLHAAHEMLDELGMALNVVHRDVSPQNVMIATDGTARLLDFGVAKATMGAHTTREGTYKGKLAYSAPEQLHGRATRQSDLYSLAVLLWESLVGHRMHGAQSEAELVSTIMRGTLPGITETLAAEREWDAIDETAWRQLQSLEPIIRKGLAVDMNQRWKTAVEMEEALVAAVRPAPDSVVAAWMKKHGKDYLDKHDRVIATEEASWRRKFPQTSPGMRRTPMPSEMRRPGTLAEGSGNRSMPNPTATKRTPIFLIAFLAMLVGALAIGVIVLLRSKEPAVAATVAPAPAATPAPTAAAAAPAAVAPAKTVEKPVELKPAAKAEEIKLPEDKTEPVDITMETVEAREVSSSPPPRGNPRKSVVRAQPQPKAKTPAKPVEVVTPPPPSPGSAKDTSCTPPYYFDGNKKIFKPQCL
jgi:serine/threonine-protein kinase